MFPSTTSSPRPSEQQQRRFRRRKSSPLMPLPNLTSIWRVIAVLATASSISSSLIPSVFASAIPAGSNTAEFGAVMNDGIHFRDSGQQVLTVPLRRVNHRGIATPSINRRFFKSEVLGVYGAAYLAELTIGTSRNGRKQVVDVLIDTGSFELWVNPNCEESSVPEYCAAFGRYDPALSSTSRKLSGNGFEIKYGSGGVTGDYYRDNIYISGAKLQGQQFGVANASDLVWFGIMGLANGEGNGFIQYPVIVDSLAAQKYTNTKLFSMDLGKQISPGAAVTGELVFGGVDRNRYAGFLKKVPTDPSDPHYKITLRSLAHRAPGARVSTPLSDTNLPLPVIVDSGTTLSLLPAIMVSKIAEQFPGAEPDGEGGYRVDCDYKRRHGTVDFEFDAGVIINVAYNDFIWDSGNGCYLGAWFSDDIEAWILGDTFLRGAYVTFDQTNHALFMSNRLSCVGGISNIIPVHYGPDVAGKIRGACPEIAVSPLARPSTTTQLRTTLPIKSLSRATTTTTSHQSTISSASPGTPGILVETTTTTITITATSGSVGSASAKPSSSAAPKKPDTSKESLTPTKATTTKKTKTTKKTTAPNTTKTSEPAEEPKVSEPAHSSSNQKQATRFETVVEAAQTTTTICPEDSHDDETTLSVPARITTAGRARESTTVSPARVTTSTIQDNGWWDVEQPQPQPQPQPQQQDEEEKEVIWTSNPSDERSKERTTTQTQPILLTTAYPSTTTYLITSCSPSDGTSCTPGLTTTRVLSVVRTLEVRPVSTASPTFLSTPTSPSPSPSPSSHHGTNNRNKTSTSTSTPTSTWRDRDRDRDRNKPVIVSGATTIRSDFILMGTTATARYYISVALALGWGFVMVVLL